MFPNWRHWWFGLERLALSVVGRIVLISGLALIASCSESQGDVNTKRDVDRARDPDATAKREPESAAGVSSETDDEPSPEAGTGDEPETTGPSALETPVMPGAVMPLPPPDSPEMAPLLQPDGTAPDPAEPRTDAGPLADASTETVAPPDAVAPTLADGLRCASTQCESGEVCIDCDQQRDANYPTCVPHPEREPERFAAATEPCAIAWLWGECDGVEDCAPGQYCVTRNVSDSDYLWSHCGQLDECEVDCIVCNDDADCPSDRHCGGELSLQPQFSTCEPD